MLNKSIDIRMGSLYFKRKKGELMSDKIITIAEVTYSRAQLIQGRLEAEGITSFLTNVNLIQSDVASGVRIKINERDKDRAKAIIKEMKHSYGENKKETVDKLKAVRRILVPVDFSEHSRNACRYALGIAHVLKAEVRLIHAYFSPALETVHYSEAYSMQINTEKFIRDIYKNASYDMKKLVEDLMAIKKERQYKNVTIDSRLISGAPEDVILDESEEYDPALVIMGHKGKGESDEVVLGSVSGYVINKLKRPVLAVPEKAKYTSIKEINNIAYATNFDDSDFDAISSLINLIKPFRMKIHCVHVEAEKEEYWDKVKIKGLSDYFAELDIPNVECKIIEADNLIDGLAEFINENDIHILSTTTRKRNFFTNLLNPSMTREILRQIEVPLLVFHS